MKLSRQVLTVLPVRTWLRRGAPRALVLALVALACLFAADASGRPGGGQGMVKPAPPPPSRPSPPMVSPAVPRVTPASPSRPTGDAGAVAPGAPGSSGSGGGGAVLVVFLLILGAIVVIILVSRSRRAPGTPGAGGATAPTDASESARATLAGLRGLDPTFSLVLFEDFLYALYAEAHQRAAAGELDLLSAYLSPGVIAAMKSEPREPVLGIVIGAMRFESAVISGEGHDARVHVEVELEVNVSTQGARGPTNAYRVEGWTLTRKASAKTPPADKTRIFGCPSCGAPQSAVMAGRCSHCNQAVSTGEFGWVVESAVVEQSVEEPPLLTNEAPEQPTDGPTIVDRDARARLDALGQRDPSFAWPAFEQRVGLIFGEFQVAWSGRDLAKMRPFLSDNLLQMQEYWMGAYRAQHLRNVTEGARIERLELARVESDASFDAITVRLWGVSKDYTVRDDGSVVCGSKSRDRRYSEYWTFIRGASRKGPARTEPVCPNCGAPLAINMAGTCTYCQAKVTSGEFDWVLSRIEQDGSYTG